MEVMSLSYDVNKPEILDYEKLFHTRRCNSSNKIKLFDLITSPDTIHRAIVFVQEKGGSPIPVFENRLNKAINNGELLPLSWHEKQFFGTVVCTVMESNGFERTGKKQKFTKGIFKTGEIYKQTTR